MPVLGIVLGSLVALWLISYLLLQRPPRCTGKPDNLDIWFPPGFLFGAATSAHQVEGGNHNQWSEWEQTNAQRLAKQANRKMDLGTGPMPAEVWNLIKAEAKNPSNYISGEAADHYHRFSEDFDILQQLGLKAYRFSIEWSRIEPQPGVYDQGELEHYRTVVDDLRRRGIEPVVSLYHWTHPVWFEAQGGWLNPKAAVQFARFVAQVMRTLGTSVRYFTVLNEPEVYLVQGYITGAWPPGKKNALFARLKARRNLFGAYLRAYRVIHKFNAQAQVSMAQSINLYEYPKWWQKLLLPILRWQLEHDGNHWFLRKAQRCGALDFVGLNHYITAQPNASLALDRVGAPSEVSDVGWGIHAHSLCSALMEVAAYDLPILVTEHGVADIRDANRPKVITGAMESIRHALDQGINVIGYCHWSLLDNFEWDKGFWPRFGLVEVTRPSLKRQIRGSAMLYKQLGPDRIQQP